MSFTFLLEVLIGLDVAKDTQLRSQVHDQKELELQP